MPDQISANDLQHLTAELAASYVANNAVHIGDLPNLISSKHKALSELGQPKVVEPEKLTPPVSIKKSITPNYLISMEDGRQYKSLKRHLAGRGLTPAEYRQKWGLPHDYPMVAQSYPEQRSQLARTLGLGRKQEVPPAPAPKGRGRKKAATVPEQS